MFLITAQSVHAHAIMISQEWDARRLMETSQASSCPSLAYQLVGTKKIQQVLAKEGIIERYEEL